MEQMDMAMAPMDMEQHIAICYGDNWLTTLLEMFPMMGMFFGI